MAALPVGTAGPQDTQGLWWVGGVQDSPDHCSQTLTRVDTSLGLGTTLGFTGWPRQVPTTDPCPQERSGSVSRPVGKQACALHASAGPPGTPDKTEGWFSSPTHPAANRTGVSGPGGRRGRQQQEEKLCRGKWAPEAARPSPGEGSPSRETHLTARSLVEPPALPAPHPRQGHTRADCHLLARKRTTGPLERIQAHRAEGLGGGGRARGLAFTPPLPASHSPLCHWLSKPVMLAGSTGGKQNSIYSPEPCTNREAGRRPRTPCTRWTRTLAPLSCKEQGEENLGTDG